MAKYHCYVLDSEGHVSRRHDVELRTDAEALKKATEIAEPLEDYSAIEVWRGNRIVGRVPRPAV